MYLLHKTRRHLTSEQAFSCAECADGKEAPWCLCLHRATAAMRRLAPPASVSRNGVALIYTGDFRSELREGLSREAANNVARRKARA